MRAVHRDLRRGSGHVVDPGRLGVRSAGHSHDTPTGEVETSRASRRQRVRNAFGLTVLVAVWKRSEMRLTRSHRLIFPALLVVSLAACGGNDDNKKEAISKSAFIEQANSRCAELNAAVATAEAALGSEPTEAAATAYIADVIVPQLSATVSDIRNLGFPKGDEALLDGMMDETETILAELKQDPASALTMADSPFTAVNARLADYGLTVCAGEG